MDWDTILWNWPFGGYTYWIFRPLQHILGNQFVLYIGNYWNTIWLKNTKKKWDFPSGEPAQPAIFDVAESQEDKLEHRCEFKSKFSGLSHLQVWLINAYHRYHPSYKKASSKKDAEELCLSVFPFGFPALDDVSEPFFSGFSHMSPTFWSSRLGRILNPGGRGAPVRRPSSSRSSVTASGEAARGGEPQDLLVIWWFPEMGVPPNHPFLWHFPL